MEKNRRRESEEIEANMQFALSYFLLFDAATLSSHAKPPADSPHDVVPVHMSFVDWVPAICSTRTSSATFPFVPPPLLPLNRHIICIPSVILRLTPALVITFISFSALLKGMPPRPSRSLNELPYRPCPLLSPRSRTLTVSRILSSFPPR